VNLGALINETLEGQTAKFAQKNQTISFQSSVSKCIVSADRDLLRMALENLIDNANKYTYEGKCIIIDLQKSRGNANIIIQDEGVGIPNNKLGKLFTKFSRLDNPLSVKVGGTGLGLYWAKKIIELHNGTIDVVSEEGKGTTFIIVLPI
jgi:signal transduction histidine kinase